MNSDNIHPQSGHFRLAKNRGGLNYIIHKSLILEIDSRCSNGSNKCPSVNCVGLTPLVTYNERKNSIATTMSPITFAFSPFYQAQTRTFPNRQFWVSPVRSESQMDFSREFCLLLLRLFFHHLAQ